MAETFINSDQWSVVSGQSEVINQLSEVNNYISETNNGKEPTTDNRPLTTENNLFPIFVKLEKFRLLIVGGGFVGMEKLSAVLVNSPATTITLIGREISDEIKEYAHNFEKVTLHERLFNATDVDNHDFIIAATDHYL